MDAKLIISQVTQVECIVTHVVSVVTWRNDYVECLILSVE